jgi:alpha-1,2-mannosyltransferase
VRNGQRLAHPCSNDTAGRSTKPYPLEITMYTIPGPARTWRADIRSAVNLGSRRRSALLVSLNLATAAIYLVHVGHRLGLGGYRIDLDVYRTGARVLLRGGDLYGQLPRLGDGHELPFTYPPFAALTFIPLTLLGTRTASWLLTAITIVSVAASLWCFAASTAAEAGTRMRLLLPWALPAALLLEPIRSTLTYGQVNALLMTLVAVDCLARAPRWPRGILVGIAAALKLTPAVFLLFFLLRRDLRSVARAGLSFAACTGAGFVLAPHDSLRYWTAIAYQPARIGGIAYASNQSILGTLARLGLSHPVRTGLWLTLCLLVAALAVTGMRGAFKTNKVTHALLLNAGAGLLISPISWSHHWVWAAPALLTCLSTTGPNRRRPLTFAVLALLTFAIAPHWLLPTGADRELHWSWWQQAVGDSYTLIGLAGLTQAVIKNLLPRLRCGVRGQRAHWQHRTARNLGPVPSGQPSPSPRSLDPAGPHPTTATGSSYPRGATGTSSPSRAAVLAQWRRRWQRRS